MADPLSPFPYFGLTFRTVREIRDISPSQAARLMNLEIGQARKYEKELLPPLRRLGMFLQGAGMSAAQFFNVMETFERLDREVRERSAQGVLRQEIADREREDFVVKVLYVSDEGHLYILDDPWFNQALAHGLQARKPIRQAVLSLDPWDRRRFTGSGPRGVIPPDDDEG